MKRNLVVLALAFLVVTMSATSARCEDTAIAPKGYVARVIEIAKSWWDRFRHPESASNSGVSQNNSSSLQNQNRNPSQNSVSNQNLNQTPNLNLSLNPTLKPDTSSPSNTSQSQGRVAAQLRLLVAHLPVVSTVTIQPVTVPPRAGLTVNGLTIPTTFQPGRPKKPVPVLAALPEVPSVKLRQHFAPVNGSADPKLETVGPFQNHVELTALESLTPEKITPVQRDMMKLLHGLFAWLLLRHDEALGLIHDVGQKTSPLIREKAFAYEGWILDGGGQKGLAALAFWRSAALGQSDESGYVDAVARSLSTLASDVALAKSAPRESIVITAASSKGLSRDARAFLILVQAERAYDHAHYNEARKLARTVPSGSAWSEAARYLAAVALLAPKDDAAATATAGRELTELFRVVEDPRVFDATAATLGRIHFLLGNYKAAHQYLAQTSRDTNLFIDAAVDNAWALLRGSDRNQAVGNMFTLHTPYFEGAYMPESYFLQGLGYQDSCQFGDALVTVKQFKSRYGNTYKTLSEFNGTNKGAAEDRESGRGAAYYNDLVAYLSQHDAKLPGLVLRELGRRPEFLRRQKELNRLARDQASVALQFPLNGAKVSSWLQDEISELHRSEIASMEQFLKHRAGEMQDELKFLTANVSLLEYEVLANAAQNLSLQGAQNFAVDEKHAITKADVEAAQKEYWPYEDEIWEDELNNFRSKMLNGCATRKPAGSS